MHVTIFESVDLKDVHWDKPLPQFTHSHIEDGWHPQPISRSELQRTKWPTRWFRGRYAHLEDLR